jgi:hypothetical protein
LSLEVIFVLRSAFQLQFFALLLTAIGCQTEATTIEGTVTFNGQPVERGSIRFVSTDKTGPTFGAVIRNGKFTVEKATPGEKIVTIHALKQNRVPTSSAEVQRMSEQAQLDENRVDAAVLIPPNAEGNNQTIQIAEGAQSLEFHLKSPQK